MFKWSLITIFLILLLLASNGLAGYFIYFVLKIPDFLKHLLQIFTFLLTGIFFKKHLNKKKQLLNFFDKSNDTLVQPKGKYNFNFKSETQTDNKGLKICPYCAESIKVKAKKCRFCGEWLNKKSEKLF